MQNKHQQLRVHCTIFIILVLVNLYKIQLE
jgi:hypothetical protein